MKDRYFFRGKDLSTIKEGISVWRFGHYVSHENANKYEIYSHRTGDVYSIDHTTLGQCTGLLENNSKLCKLFTKGTLSG